MTISTPKTGKMPASWMRLTGQKPTWYLQMCSGNKKASKIGKKASMSLEDMFIFPGKYYILIITRLSGVCCDSAPALYFSIAKYLPPARG